MTIFEDYERSIIIQENEDTKTFNILAVQKGKKTRKIIYSKISIVDLSLLGAAISTYAANWMRDEVRPKPEGYEDYVDHFFVDP